MMMIVFVSAFGFVGSALIAYSGGLLAGGTGSYQLSFKSIATVLVGFFICMFAGPFITVEQSLSLRRAGQISFSALIFAIMVSLVWSFCSGVLFILLLAHLGLIVV